MKSKFAKIVDNSIGAVIVFCAVTAVFRYFLPLSASAFCAACITSCALFLSALRRKRKEKTERISREAADMFFDFMFKSCQAPAFLLCRALQSKKTNAERHGNGVYCGKTAAFFYFDTPPSERDCARMIARAKHYGATKVYAFCKTLPRTVPQVEGFSFTAVDGDATYKLFRSLDCMPKRAFAAKKRGKPYKLSGAFDKDKIARYLVLSAALFAIAAFTDYSIITLVCAGVCALLFVIASVVNIVKYVKKQRRDTV